MLAIASWLELLRRSTDDLTLASFRSLFPLYHQLDDGLYG